MSSQLGWPGDIDLDRASREPLSGQLAAALERRISSGSLPEGTRLPATRDLAATLKINRGTVQAAYRHLQQAVLARGRVGSGTIVHAPLLSPSRFDADALLSRGCRACPEDSPLPALLIWILPADSGRAVFPLEGIHTRWRKPGAGARLWVRSPARVGSCAARLRPPVRAGPAQNPDEILVTRRAAGLDLVFQVTDPETPSSWNRRPTRELWLARLRGSDRRLPMGPTVPTPEPLLATRPSSST